MLTPGLVGVRKNDNVAIPEILRERWIPLRRGALARRRYHEAKFRKAIGVFFALAEIHDRSGWRRDQLWQPIRYLRLFRLAFCPAVTIPVILRILLLTVTIDA